MGVCVEISFSVTSAHPGGGHPDGCIHHAADLSQPGRHLSPPPPPQVSLLAAFSPVPVSGGGGCYYVLLAISELWQIDSCSNLT